MSALPKLTALQFLVIYNIGESKLGGDLIRNVLKQDYGIRMSGPAFYQLMARMEKAKLVRGEYHKTHSHGQAVRCRFYTATPKGIREVNATVRFYSPT